MCTLENPRSDWASYDCKSSYDGYAESDMENLQLGCPETCGLCDNGDDNEAVCVDSSISCRQWNNVDCFDLARRLREGFSEDTLNEEIINCPASCDACLGTSRFVPALSTLL
jgi:hypothetical protein